MAANGPAPAIVRAHVLRLARAADGDEGSEPAAAQLVELAAFAAKAVENLYNRRPKLVKKVAEQRDDFPVLRSWKKHRNLSVEQMLKSLPLGNNGLWKTQRIVQDEAEIGLHWLLVELVVPHFEEIRTAMGPDEGALDGLDREIASLPPLSRIASGKWATLAARWCAALGDGEILGDPKSPLHRLAKPGALREFNKRKKKAMKSFTSKNEGSAPAEFLENDLTLKSHAFPKQQQREHDTTRRHAAKVEKMAITDGDLRNGLRDAFKKRLDSILKSAPRTEGA